MRLLTMIFGLAFAVCGHGAGKKVALSVTQKQHHATQYSSLYREGDKWFCDSDLGKRHPLVRKPASLDLAKRVKNSGKGCANSFQLEVAGKGNRVACADHEGGAAFLKALAKECGRF